MRNKETAYIIVRDNENGYKSYRSSEPYPNDWVWSLFEAKYYFDEKQAEEQCKKNRDCRVSCYPVKVKIEIVNF